MPVTFELERSPNRAAVRRWLSRALDGWATDWVVGPDGEPIEKDVPDWASMLHVHGAWRYMSRSHVRRVHFNPDLQDALLSLHMLGGRDAVFGYLRDQGLMDAPAEHRRGRQHRDPH